MFLIYLIGLVAIPVAFVVASVRSHSKMVRKYGAEALKQIRKSGPAPM